MEEEEPILCKDEERKRVRLPPIIQAASRPRNLTRSGESEGLLRGQKATRFIFERKTQVMEQKPNSTKRRRHERHSGKQSVQENFDVKDQKQDQSGLTEKKKSRGKVQKLDNKEEGRKCLEAESSRKKRTIKLKFVKRKLISLREERKEKAVTGDVEAKIEEHREMRSRKKPHYFTDLKDITSKTNEMRMADNPRNAILTTDSFLHPKTERLVEPENINAKTLIEGDYVAIKVPEKLYIKGQPCLGRVTSLPDNLGLITVHYYTGSYSGFWRPMMSRTSPYLRKVPLASVLCKFNISANGRMSPVTATRVREVVDGTSEKT